MGKDVDSLVEKAKTNTFDLSLDEDLSLAIMNLVSLEEHAYFTAMKTDKPEYFELLQELRAKRTELMALIVKEPEGEVWCMSKHLLSTTMRLIETGNKFRPTQPAQAEALYHHAFDCYALFWRLNRESSGKRMKSSSTKAEKVYTKTAGAGVMAKARSWVKEAIDCCIER